ncbi:MAG: hypothetical protein KJ638_15350 [Chloroflexi bacterium]|nr:hypothetical protein [Chloroflexota bacterium]
MNREFRPELISRRGELIAWILSIIALVSLGVALIWGAGMSWAGIIFVLILLLSAGSISLGNWVDRKTVLSLSLEGVSFRNGLRNVSLKWDQIQELRLLPDRWGVRVHVWGAESRFNFRMLGEVKVRGELKGRVGFAEGESILQEILESSGLQENEQNENGRYYARP